MSGQSEFADLELADLEGAFTHAQLSGAAHATRKPLVTVQRDVAEVAPSTAIAQAVQRAAPRPAVHGVRRALQCALDAHAHLAASPDAAVRRDAGAALASAKELLASTRRWLARPSAEGALADDVVRDAAVVLAFLKRVLADDLLKVASATVVPPVDTSSSAAAREQRAFLERERAKVLLSPRSSSSSSSATVPADAADSSPAALAEAARLERALARKPGAGGGAARDAKRKTWGAKSLEAEFAAAEADAAKASPPPRAAPVVAEVHVRAPPPTVVAALKSTPPTTPIKTTTATTTSTTPIKSPMTSAAIDAEEARLQRTLNRGPRTSVSVRPVAAVNEDAVPNLTPEKRDRRKTWSAVKAQAEQASPRATADFAQSVADVAKTAAVVSPRSSYTAAPNTSTPPPRVSATRGDADRFNAQLDSLTRALGGSPAAADKSPAQKAAQAERRAALEREQAEREAKQREQLRRDEEAFQEAKKRADELRRRAEAEAKAKQAALEKANEDERAARLARRDAEIAAERQAARRAAEERAAAVAAEKEAAAAKRAADAERARAQRATAAPAAAPSPAPAFAAAHSPAPAQLKTAATSVRTEHSVRARSGTVEKVMRSTVKELTADDDDTAAAAAAPADDSNAKWDGIGEAMNGLVHELDDLASVTSAAGTPIVQRTPSAAVSRTPSADVSHSPALADLDAERAALARERAKLAEERRLLEEERSRFEQRKTDAVLDSMISELRTFPLVKSADERLAAKQAYRSRISLTDLERAFIEELRALRRAPRAYAALLREARVPFFHGRQLNLARNDGSQVALATAEGVAAALEAIEQLERTPALPDLTLVDGLTFAARDAISRNSLQPNAVERILEYGDAQGHMRQNVWMSSLPALQACDIVMAMLISDGDPKRQQRTALLAPDVHCIGVCAGHALQYAANGTYLIVVLCEHFED